MNNSPTNQIKSLENSAPKKSHFWKWFWCVAVVLIALAFWSVGKQFRTVPLRISKETTFVTAPLKSDGKSVDFLKAFEVATCSDKIATDENGYRIIAKRFGPSPEATPEEFAVVCEKLGLNSSTITNDVIFEDINVWLKKYCSGPGYDVEFIRSLDAKLDGSSPTEEPFASKNYDSYDTAEVLESRMSKPWTLEDLPMMGNWLSVNQDAISVLHEAVGKPVFEIPLARVSEDQLLMELPFPEVMRMRSFCRSLQAYANCQIGLGKIDSAIDAMLTCKRLGRFIQNESTVIHRLTGVAIESIADSIGIAGSIMHQPSKEQLQRLQFEIVSAPDRVSLERALLYSRLDALDLAEHFSRNRIPEYFEEMRGLGEIRFLKKLGLDWNVVTRRINEQYDAGNATGDGTRRDVEFQDYYSIRIRSQFAGDFFLNLALYAIVEADRRTVCSNHLQQIVLAMLLYEKDHGTLPPAFSVDQNGKPLHSWRVLLLPYLGQQELYDQLRLDEPWDSPHNKKFWNENLPFYRCPSHSNAKPGQTTYSVVVGAESAFDGGVGKRLDSFGANRGSLILVAERLNPICWMDPLKEIPLSIADNGINVEDPKTGKKVSGLASDHPSGIQFGLCDGSVEFVSEVIDQGVLKAMLRGTHLGRGVLE